ncbi:laccase-4-like isoform X2 [Photinus pyralis]|nr:laccase-4-like isoform X2 [Photinus pyralis]XP_031333115.1 laccase-4-like isoform X2 [Photinus pyralis]
MGESTSIHWHGYHQKASPYMDGVPFVTQCPIQPGTTFRYRFTAEQSGTHFWHSHTGVQRADGAFGAFIVRTPPEDNPHHVEYDYDLSSHVMIVLDWEPQILIEKFLLHHHSNGDNKADTLLVNGMGRFKNFSISNSTVFTPTARFVVKKGYRYRFRVINAEFMNCPIELSLDNHTITIISSDGNDLVPITAESVVTYAGERFDFVLNADQPTGLYWMRFRGLMDCDERFTSAHQAAVLQYKGMSNSDYPKNELHYHNTHKNGLEINSLNTAPGKRNSVSIVELQSLDVDWDPCLKDVPDYKFFISYDFYKIDNPHFHKSGLYGYADVLDVQQQLQTPQLNHISLKLPSFPLLPGRNQLDTSLFCNKSNTVHCNESYCECTHVLQVPLNSVVELILIDRGFSFDANHPFHLHGHTFRVIGMGRIGRNVTEEEITILDGSGFLKRNMTRPPKKDTVTVPDGGYTILRFLASNPGYWLFHCHIEFHIEIGMALVFKVGEHSEMLPAPNHFPECGDYIPNENVK